MAYTYYNMQMAKMQVNMIISVPAIKISNKYNIIAA